MEVLTTAKLNRIKQDTILKNFWKNNDRFADLFNTFLFNGKEILKPDDLTEVDTDVSSMLKFNGHAETVQKILDVVKKTAYGIDFMILGLENQSHIHYAMPLRHMIGDAFSYQKEYNEIVAKNKKERNFASTDEFLSKFRKTDRLHGMVTLCIYYGEKEWDGPLSLVDMLDIPDKLKFIFSDYKFNLIQMRSCKDLHFHNSDINTVFDLSSSIYNRDYEKINSLYKNQPISPELALVVGAITESQELIDHALENEKKGAINMCTALEELKKEGVQEGLQEGLQKGLQEGLQKGEVKGIIQTCKLFNPDQEAALKLIMDKFSLSQETALDYIKKYW